jgi:hypothetical protein
MKHAVKHIVHFIAHRRVPMKRLAADGGRACNSAETSLHGS